MHIDPTTWEWIKGLSWGLFFGGACVLGWMVNLWEPRSKKS